MDTVVKNILNIRSKAVKKTIGTADLLRETELKMGSEAFELQGGYNRFYNIIKKMQTEHNLLPVKASGINGRNPVLYNKYKVSGPNEKTDENKGEINEILALHPQLKREYYLKNIRQYQKDREQIYKISNFFFSLHESHALEYRCTLNERSFEIFGDEKLLSDKGEAFLKRLGLNFEDLNCYKTYEAFFYYYLDRSDINNVLVIENKDTFISLVKACNIGGCNREGNIQLLVYGEGNKIQNSFKFMDELAANLKIGTVFYFGDLDYPGIDIFLRLKERYLTYRIVPHICLYRQLVNSVEEPPFVRNDKTTDIREFLTYFDKNDADRMDKLLKERKFIPQEGINFARGEFQL